MLKNNPNSSKETKESIRKLNKSNILLSKLSNQFPKNPIKIKVIEETIHQLEIQLSQNNNSFKNLLKLNDINSTQISSQLQKKQLYIDFARGEKNYYIFTVDHNNTINFLQIDENDTNIVDLNIKAFHHNSKQMAKKIKENSLTISLKKASKKEAQNILQQLHTSIIDKYLKKIIQSKNHLIISADGLLNFLPFEALYNHQSYLIEKYKISYVSSGREFLRQINHGHKSKSSNVVVFGSPNFWFDLQNSSKTKSAITKDNATIFDMKFSTLESSKEEIEIMKKYYPNLKIYTDSNATIENLFTLKSPKILHISTHGFFLNNKNNPNPMLASGLAFAGANYANYKDDARGIATALQLTGLELQNTELVVLSACETALGKIHNAEGVTGLSKAFIQAGAKKVVMSLWKVSVQETITTMHYFYANIDAGNNYATALRQAKLHMITMHPYYWSAFIMNGI
jgi:CHAT domain-containing protein